MNGSSQSQNFTSSFIFSVKMSSVFLLSFINVPLPRCRIYYLVLYHGYVLKDVINEPGDPFLHKTSTAVERTRTHRYIMILSDKPRPTGRLLRFQNAIHHSTLKHAPADIQSSHSSQYIPLRPYFWNVHHFTETCRFSSLHSPNKRWQHWHFRMKLRYNNKD
jgi:hypothetical protein